MLGATVLGFLNRAKLTRLSDDLIDSRSAGAQAERQSNDLQQKLKEKKLQLNVFFIYTGKELPDFSTVKEKLKLILNKLMEIADENNSSNS